MNLSKLVLFLFVVALGLGTGFVGANGSEDELRESFMPMVLKCSVNKDGKICKVHEILPLDIDLAQGLNGPLAVHDENGDARTATMQGVCLMKDGSKKLLHGIFILGHQGVIWFIPHGIRIFKNAYDITTSAAQTCFGYLGNQIPAALALDFDIKNLFGREETDAELAERLQMEEFEAAEKEAAEELANSKN